MSDELDQRDRALVNTIRLEVITALDKHEEKIHEANKESRATMYLEGTGYDWADKKKVRAIIKHGEGLLEMDAVSTIKDIKEIVKESKRNKAIATAAFITLATGTYWEHLMKLFK